MKTNRAAHKKKNCSQFAKRESFYNVIIQNPQRHPMLKITTYSHDKTNKSYRIEHLGQR